LAANEYRLRPSNDQFAFSPRFADFNNDRLTDLAVASDIGRSQLYM
jgi:hypothetical protein